MKTIFQIVLFVLLAFVKPAVDAADIWYAPYYTNATVVANSRQILDAIQSSDTKNYANISNVIGSQVAYFGTADAIGVGTNINVYKFISKDSNRVACHLHIILNVEWQPWRDVRPSGAVSFVEILGTLKSVDVQRRVIYIRANPNDYRECWTL